MPPRRTTRTPRRLVHRDVTATARRDGTYDRLYEAQGGKCAICGKPPKAKGRSVTVLDIDHDHKTLLIRGLLCRGCNMRLRPGMTPEWLRQTADYLEGSWAAPTTESEAPRPVPIRPMEPVTKELLDECMLPGTIPQPRIP